MKVYVYLMKLFLGTFLEKVIWNMKDARWNAETYGNKAT